MNPFDEMKKLFEDLRKTVDTAFACAQVALTLGSVMLEENKRLIEELDQLKRERAAVGAFGFQPSGVRS